MSDQAWHSCRPWLQALARLALVELLVLLVSGLSSPLGAGTLCFLAQSCRLLHPLSLPESIIDSTVSNIDWTVSNIRSQVSARSLHVRWRESARSLQGWQRALTA